MATYRREIGTALLARLREPRRFIQFLFGARQVGKTTIALQVKRELEADIFCHYASADQAAQLDPSWLENEWARARNLAAVEGGGEGILILDEVQKAPRWSEVVKRLWDEDGRNGMKLKVVLLGSSPLLMCKGLTESLAGRFEIGHAGHWTYAEMREAFGWDLEQFIFHGGYPGAAALITDPSRWTQYIQDSIIESTLARDLFGMVEIRKPALLRRLLLLGCEYSGQILSYNKMLGQMQDAGNTTTLAHYLDLTGNINMLAGLSSYSGSATRSRGSSPKLQVYNTALMAALEAKPFSELRGDLQRWGRFVESAVGVHLLAGIAGSGIELQYWRQRGMEVDFVLRKGEALLAVEVKSGTRQKAHSGLAAFKAAYPSARTLLVGGGGVPVEEFLNSPVGELL